MQLTETELHWDNKVLTYDLSKYNWGEWALSVIREIEPQVSSLESLGDELDAPRLLRAQQHVQKACSRNDFMRRIDTFMSEYVPPRIGNRRFLVQRQGTLRCVIPEQSKAGRRLSFHQGIWVGNGRGLRTVWTPYTKCSGTNSMQMLPLEISREITRKVFDLKWDLETFEKECLKHSFPIELEPGHSWLFFQEHIHGNVNNETNYTRVSMDLRILVEGEEYHRKLPGGYFRMLGDYESDLPGNYTGRKFVTYANWNSSFSTGIPLPMQRLVIDSYCTKNKISSNDDQFENEYLDWCPGLRSYIREKPDGIVLCSIYSLPDNPDWRSEILELALENGVELHFANEICSLKSRADLKKISTYLSFGVKSSRAAKA